MKKAQNIIIAILFGLSLFSQWEVGQARAATIAARVRGDSIAAEAVVDAFAQDSTWEVRFAAQSDHLAQRFSESDDTARARLGAELNNANVRIELLAEVLSSAQGEVVSVGNRVGARADSLSVAIETCSGAWEGQIDDGLLVASWGFFMPEVRHVLDYRVEIPGELVVGEAGDGRTIVSARALHPRASLQLDSIFVDRPDPITVPGLSVKQAFVALLLGAVGWEFAR